MPDLPFLPEWVSKPSAIADQARLLSADERPAAFDASEMYPCLELRVSPDQVLASGVTMTVREDEVHGVIHECSYRYQDVHLALRTVLGEGPHYVMLSVDLIGCVESGHVPSEFVESFLEMAGLDVPFRSWSNPGLDRMYEELRTARTTPLSSIPRFGPEAGTRD